MANIIRLKVTGKLRGKIYQLNKVCAINMDLVQWIEPISGGSSLWFSEQWCMDVKESLDDIERKILKVKGGDKDA